MARRAIAYIDGFNLYYGAVKGDPPLKWLDVQAMCEAVLRNHDVAAVRYYTARVTDRSDDPARASGRTSTSELSPRAPRSRASTASSRSDHAASPSPDPAAAGCASRT